MIMYSVAGLSKQAGSRRSSAGYFKFHRRLFLNSLSRTQLCACFKRSLVKMACSHLNLQPNKYDLQ